jgi:ATP-dependent Clp protease ATP-binding subunit ClpA
MSEYMESYSVSRLIGAPPGYIGYEEGGQLTEAVRRHPYSVILLDEVEKAHRDVWNVFLQILDEGFVTDGKGRRVNMRNTIIIMTSNLGSCHSGLAKNPEISDTEHGSFVPQDDVVKIPTGIMAELQKYFRVEFLNRIDDIVVYNTLTEIDMISIVQLLLSNLETRLLKKNISVTWSEGLIQKIALLGYDEELGARPLARAISEYIVNPLSQKLLDGTL